MTNYWWTILALAAVLIGRSAWGAEQGRTAQPDPFRSDAAVVRESGTGQPQQRLRGDPFFSNSYRLEDYSTGGNGMRVKPNPFGEGWVTEPER